MPLIDHRPQEHSVSTNPFQQILTAAAAQGAAAGAQAFCRPVDFDGTRTQPSEGFVLPVAPATKVPFAHQLAAVETILSHRRVMLGLQPGMGKTLILQATAAALVAEGKRVLVIVPPSLRFSPWAQDFAADFPQVRVAMVEGKKAEAFPTDADVVVIGHSPIFAARIEDVKDWAPDAVLVDEAHNFKNREAQCSKALLGLADSMPSDAVVVLATGTPVTNRAEDVYSPLRITGTTNAKAVSGSQTWSGFMGRWCRTKMVWNGRANIMVSDGCIDPEGLRDALVTSCMVSVPREEVLDLPERTTAVRSLVLNGDATEYRRMEREFLSWIRETKGDDAMRRAAKAEAITRLMTLWEADGKAKVKAASEYVGALVEQDEQVVVFAHHRSVIEGLYERFLNQGMRVGTIIGGMSSEAKAEVVDAFQNGDLDVVIGNLSAAGTGITLTAARHVVFVSLPWAPGTYGQAQDRIYRIGQKNSVETHVLNGVDMVSEHLWGVLMAKVAVADAVNTGTQSTIDFDSVEEAVLESYGW